MEGRNYEDKKCFYGYMTLCIDCAASVRLSRRHGNKMWSHVDATKEVPGFPVFKCGSCGCACSAPDNDDYKQQEAEMIRNAIDTALAEYLVANPGSRPSTTSVLDLMTWLKERK